MGGYQQISDLSSDPRLNARISACCTEQANTYKDDGRADIAALAADVLRGTATLTPFYQLTAAAPGLADKATGEDGSVDSTLITDGDILSSVQATWPTVAALFHPAEPTP